MASQAPSGVRPRISESTIWVSYPSCRVTPAKNARPSGVVSPPLWRSTPYLSLNVRGGLTKTILFTTEVSLHLMYSPINSSNLIQLLVSAIVSNERIAGGMEKLCISVFLEPLHKYRYTQF